jgi:long-chain acyl-CoA synthetase
MFNNLLEIPYKTAQEYGDRISHQYYVDKELKQHSFKDFTQNIGVLTGGFKTYGLEPEDHVSFFVNNRYDWIVTDFALMALQTVSVPRGSDSTPRELQFIFHHSDSQWLILENTTQLKELLREFKAEDWQKCKGIFLVDRGELAEIEDLTGELKDKIFFYDQIKEKGRVEFNKDPLFIENQIKKIDSGDLMTIVYTSGTTGNPKGVMLTHRNFLQNVEANTPRLQIDPEKAEKTVVMLPSWHVYERAFEFCAIHSALTLHYSSAPRFAQDLLEVKPEVIISVPRVWESIYQKMLKAISKMPGYKRFLIFFFVKCNQIFLSSSLYLKGGYISLKKRSLFRKFWARLYSLTMFALTWPGHHISKVLFKPFRERVGGRLRAATSAAGSLPKYLDELFNSLGIPIVNAYGMTECAPGIMSRTLDCNTFGTVGIPFNNTQVEIRREDGTLTEIGEKGVLFAKGDQVMPGYYKNPEATSKAIQDGWMNTGDLAVWSENGEAIIVGRLKDTIVLMGGRMWNRNP